MSNGLVRTYWSYFFVRVCLVLLLACSAIMADLLPISCIAGSMSLHKRMHCVTQVPSVTNDTLDPDIGSEVTGCTYVVTPDVCILAVI